MGKNMGVPQKTKLPHMVILLVGYISRRTEEIEGETGICISLFTAALFVVDKTWKQPKYPLTDEWRHKMWCS